MMYDEAAEYEARSHFRAPQRQESEPDDCADETAALRFRVEPTRAEAPAILPDLDVFAERDELYATIAAQKLLIDALTEDVASLRADLWDMQNTTSMSCSEPAS